MGSLELVWQVGFVICCLSITIVAVVYLVLL